MLITWQKWALGLTGVVLLISGGTAVSYKVRGLRNSNPGNLRLTSIQWEGKVPNEENTDGEFEQFYNAEDGIRAMARNLLTYYGRGLDTIEKIISTYAPDNENNTGAYIRSVEKFTGIDAKRVYPVDQIRSLVKAIITHENGLNPYRDETITRAVQRAGWNA
jgi:hypothetical protein